MAKYYKKKDSYFNSPKPPKEGMVPLGRGWITEEEAKRLIGPSEYDPRELEVICTLTKKRSPYFCAYIIDPLNDKGDSHFIMCMYVRHKNSKIAYLHTLVKQDMLNWITANQNMEKYNAPVWNKKYDSDKKLETFLNL